MNIATLTRENPARIATDCNGGWHPLTLLEKIAAQHHGIASKLVVFGSVARGDPSPNDIDVVLLAGRDEWATLAAAPSLRQLLAICRAHYGRLDAFVLTGTSLYVRNGESTDFVRAKSAAALRAAIAKDGVPLLDLLARMQAGLSVAGNDSIEDSAVTSVCSELRLPRLAVVDLVTLPVSVLRERDQYLAPNNALAPADFPRYQSGAAKIVSYMTAVSESYIDYLDEFDSSTLLYAEGEDQIKQHATYHRYIEMRRQGFEPPYVQVCENERGQLITSNRRRTLVAQELRLPIKGWRSPHNHATNLPVKYGDVLAAYARALTALRADHNVAPAS